MLSWIASCCHGSPKKGPIGEEAGVMSCRPAMLGAAKQGFSFIQCLFHCVFVLAQLTTKGKKNTITQPCRVKNKRKHRNKRNIRISPLWAFQTPPVTVLAFSWSKRINFKSQAFSSLQSSNLFTRNLSKRIRQLYKQVSTWTFIAALLLRTRNNFKCINKKSAKQTMVRLYWNTWNPWR